LNGLNEAERCIHLLENFAHFLLRLLDRSGMAILRQQEFVLSVKIGTKNKRCRQEPKFHCGNLLGLHTRFSRQGQYSRGVEPEANGRHNLAL
jgi:hypothetical protein